MFGHHLQTSNISIGSRSFDLLCDMWRAWLFHSTGSKLKKKSQPIHFLIHVYRVNFMFFVCFVGATTNERHLVALFVAVDVDVVGV